MSMDQQVKSSLACAVAFDRRFVDDVLVLHASHVSVVFADFIAFHPSIIVTHDSKEVSNATTFLDLSISIESNSIMYQTYRKPMNTYHYLPSISCHSHRTFRAIVHTELYRLLVTNREAHAFEFKVAFFRSHFIARGHSRYLFDQNAAAYQWHAKPDILQRSSTKTSRSIVLLGGSILLALTS